MSNDVNDFLFAGGAPSAKFPTIGTLVKGTVVSSEVTQQTDLDGKLKYWDNDTNKPMMQAVITLQTDLRDPEIDDDQGLRRLFVKGQMQAALRDALQKAGAKLEVGGTLAVKYEKDEKASKAGYNPKKVYVAAYQAPTSSVNDLLDAPEPESVGAAATGVAPADLLG